MEKTVRIGAGMGFYGDTIRPALEVAKKGDVQYICFDALAELTMAILEKARKKDPSKGFTNDITLTMKTLLPECYPKGIKLITNAGGINPKGAAQEVIRVAEELGFHDLKVGVVTGDDIHNRIGELQEKGIDFVEMGTGELLEKYKDRMLFASVYLGAQPIVEALRQGADVIVTGRTTDTAQFAAPLIYEFGWDFDEWNKIGAAILLGHLLECSGQASGGNFSGDWWNIEGIDQIGYPIGEVHEDGTFYITKAPGTGGKINVDTVKEQFLYEIHDPSNYITPDAIVDFTTAILEDVGPDRVKVSNVTGKPAPPTLKALIGYENGWSGEGMLGYTWPHALEKARKAEQILRTQIEKHGIQANAIHTSFLGYNSMHGPMAKQVQTDELNEVYLRIAIQTDEKGEAAKLGRLLPPLAINGPPFGGVDLVACNVRVNYLACFLV